MCLDVDGYKIVNIYKPPPTRLRSLDLPVFPHPCLYAGDFNCRRADWVTMITVRTVSTWLPEQVLIVLPSYIIPRTPPVFYSGRWNTGTHPDLAFVGVGPNSRLPG